MKEWYARKMKFHHRQWELAQESNKIKSAEHHMNEYLNYKNLHDSVEQLVYTKSINPTR